MLHSIGYKRVTKVGPVARGGDINLIYTWEVDRRISEHVLKFHKVEKSERLCIQQEKK